VQHFNGDVLKYKESTLEKFGEVENKSRKWETSIKISDAIKHFTIPMIDIAWRFYRAQRQATSD